MLEPHADRITWDAPIHSVADIVGLPFPPRTLNFKPSRFGSVRRLFEGYDYCAEHGIGALKARWLPLVRSDAERALFARVRAAFDPAGILYVADTKNSRIQVFDTDGNLTAPEQIYVVRSLAPAGSREPTG